LRCCELGSLLIVQHGGDHLVAALGKLDGSAAAKTASGAGDEHCLGHLFSYPAFL
jgi:hypothetical protein